MAGNYRLQQHVKLVEMSKGILKSTCQFFMYKDDKPGFLVANGCGILFSHNQNFYCFSNAHVLADAHLGKTFILMREGKTSTLGGEYYYSKAPAPNKRKEDTIDIALVRLTKVTVETLKERGYEFLNQTDILTGYSLLPDNNLMVAAYPGSFTKIDGINRRVIPKPFLYRTKPFLKSLSQLNYPPEYHFVAKYARSSTIDAKTGHVRRGPMPHGISGSGLWLIKTQADGSFKPFLIGILSEYLENRALLVSTKIDVGIGILKNQIDPSIHSAGAPVNFLKEIKI